MKYCPNNMDVHGSTLKETRNSSRASLFAIQQMNRRTGGEVSWIVQDACHRLRDEIGTYRWDQWREVARLLGITVEVVSDMPVPKGCIIGDLIVVRWDSDPVVVAERVWHEISHAYLHAGNRDIWGQVHCGQIILSKFERQAREFAEQYPVWE